MPVIRKETVLCPRKTGPYNRSQILKVQGWHAGQGRVPPNVGIILLNGRNEVFWVNG